MKKTLKLLWALLPIVTFASCYEYPDELDQAEEQLVAITKYDTSLDNADYQSYETFSINDSIVVIQDQSTISRVSDKYSDHTIQKVAGIMSQRGYTQVVYDSVNPPDLAVTVYAYQITNVTAYYPGWWYNYYDYYYYWDWAWYPYDYYYPYSFVTSYSVGTLGIEVADLTTANGKGQHPIIWLGVVRGVINGGHTQSEIDRTIDECFNQIPYNILRK